MTNNTETAAWLDLPPLPDPDDIKGPNGYMDVYFPHTALEIQQEAFEAGVAYQLAQQRQAAPHAQAEPVARVERIISAGGLAEVSVFLESALKVGTKFYAAPAPQEAEQSDKAAAANVGCLSKLLRDIAASWDNFTFSPISQQDMLAAADAIDAQLPIAMGAITMVDMVDAAMVEMASIYPPLRRSECERLIRAAITTAQEAEQASASPAGVVKDWLDAEKASRDAVEVYNAAVRESDRHIWPGTGTDTEFHIMSTAKNKAFHAMLAMYDALLSTTTKG